MKEKDYYVDHIYDEAIIEKYCKDVCIVQGLKTYVLNPGMLDVFLSDTDLSEKIKNCFTEKYVSWIKSFAEIYPNILPALVFLHKAKVFHHDWEMMSKVFYQLNFIKKKY